MHEFEMLFKEAEVSNLQFESAVANIMVNDAVFEESGDGDGFFAKLKKVVCDFVDNMITTIKNIFLKFSSSKAREKAEKAVKADSKLANKKVKATDWKKVHVLNKDVQKKINSAKSKEEVDQIMREYKAKRNKIIAATAAATVTVGALLIFFTRGKSKNAIAEIEEQKKGMDYGKKSESPDPVKDVEIKKAKATADAEIRKIEVKDTVAETKENIKLISDEAIISDEAVKALKNKMNGSSIKDTHNFKDASMMDRIYQSNMKKWEKQLSNPKAHFDIIEDEYDYDKLTDAEKIKRVKQVTLDDIKDGKNYLSSGEFPDIAVRKTITEMENLIRRFK